jgi:hypothetical protein
LRQRPGSAAGGQLCRKIRAFSHFRTRALPASD